MSKRENPSDPERSREEYARAAAPLIAELRNAGFAVQDVEELYRTKQSYKAAIPILIAWLPRVLDDRVKETIVRALTVRSARPSAASPLIAEFRRLGIPNSLRWAIGNALSIVADDSVADALFELMRDKSFGSARQMVAVAIGNLRDPQAPGVLVGMLGDEEIAGHAVMGLSRLALPETRNALEKMREHPKSWIRHEVKKALERIDSNAARKR